MQRNVIITGAGGALGSETVKAFAENEGYTVHSVDGVDLADIHKAQDIVQKIQDIDVLINIAGGFIWKEIQETHFEDFEAQFNMNFKTMYNMTMATLPKIKNSANGRIINIGAMGAVHGGAGMAAYASSKSAVMRFTETLASETPDTMTVNAILPSIINTPMNRADMADADFSKWVTIDELVNPLMFLASRQSSGINGALIPVCGRV